MNKTYKVVIIDDHPLITESYKAAVEEVFAELKKAVKISVYNDLDSVLNEMTNVDFILDLDLILLTVF